MEGEERNNTHLIVVVPSMISTQGWMGQYFERMQSLSDNKELPSRIRFMLMDVIELRKNKVDHYLENLRWKNYHLLLKWNSWHNFCVGSVSVSFYK